MGGSHLVISPHKLLKKYPNTQIFVNKVTKKPVRACLWNTGVKIFFNGKKHKGVYGEKSIQVGVKEFNNRFCLPESGVAISKWFIPSLYEKKKCTACGNRKLLHEFSKIPKLGGIRKDQCKTCIKQRKVINKSNCSEYMLKLDRSSRNNFIAYMTIRPYYFAEIFGVECTKENIETAFDNLNTPPEFGNRQGEQ
jgi:hypothetical protein